MSDKNSKKDNPGEDLPENNVDASVTAPNEKDDATEVAKEEEEEEVELSKEEKLKNENEELNDRFLRLYSEFDNFKRRTAKERIELYKTAGEDVILALLPVLDDLDRAINSNAENNDIESVKEGFKLVEGKLKTALEQKGLENMNSLHTKFDTDMHEAITNIPAPKRKLKGKVVDVIEKGYLLNGNVIRYAKVVVGN